MFGGGRAGGREGGRGWGGDVGIERGIEGIGVANVEGRELLQPIAHIRDHATMNQRAYNERGIEMWRGRGRGRERERETVKSRDTK